MTVYNTPMPNMVAHTAILAPGDSLVINGNAAGAYTAKAWVSVNLNTGQISPFTPSALADDELFRAEQEYQRHLREDDEIPL